MAILTAPFEHFYDSGSNPSISVACSYWRYALCIIIIITIIIIIIIMDEL